MTVDEILKQAQTLSPQERQELAKLLIDTLEPNEPITQAKTGAEIVAMLEAMEPIEFVDPEIDTATAREAPSEETWGQKLVRMMDEFGPIDMIHPEIEDATEWVKQIRRDQEIKRGLDWDKAE